MVSSFILWLAAYALVKGVARWKWGEPSWDPVCLIHNILSVCTGAIALWHWDAENATAACGDVTSPSALVLSLQAIHCITDFAIYLSSMIKEPVFIAHHSVLLVAALVLPSCPGCQSTVWAFSIAEFGSGAIAVDAEWRKLGLHSRGMKRLLFFGGSRIVNLYLLYHILTVTPLTQYFTLSSRGTDLGSSTELLTLNIPVCLIASIGGSGLMLIINGITWFRMLGAYRKRQQRQLASQSPSSVMKDRFKAFVDAQLFLVFAGCFCIRVARHFGGGAWAEGIPMEYLLFLSTGLFCAEPSISVVTSSCLDGGRNSTNKAE